jgi:hypothetical protein
MQEKEIVLIGKNRKNIRYFINDGGCWICTSHAYDKDGYPLFTHPKTKKLIHIHRYMYEQKFGNLKSFYCCHTCDTPACINPDHLFLGTPKDNAIDCLIKGRHTDKRGEKHHLAKLTSDNVLAIRKDTRGYNKIALEYNVSWACIYGIKKKTRWGHL